jgi:hypothetical protein
MICPDDLDACAPCSDWCQWRYSRQALCNAYPLRCWWPRPEVWR